jgi:AraC-like DNA-binding protein
MYFLKLALSQSWAVIGSIMGFLSLVRAQAKCIDSLRGIRLRHVLEYIDANFKNDATLDNLAGVAGYSSFHFARKFTLAMRIPPHHYISRMRLEYAMVELAAGKLPLAEIPLNAHFSPRRPASRERFIARPASRPTNIGAVHLHRSRAAFIAGQLAGAHDGRASDSRAILEEVKSPVRPRTILRAAHALAANPHTEQFHDARKQMLVAEKALALYGDGGRVTFETISPRICFSLRAPRFRSRLSRAGLSS